MAKFSLVFSKNGTTIATAAWQGTLDGVKAHARRQISFQDADMVEVLDSEGGLVASYDKPKAAPNA